jgi:hypothetical protein
MRQSLSNYLIIVSLNEQTFEGALIGCKNIIDGDQSREKLIKFNQRMRIRIKYAKRVR